MKRSFTLIVIYCFWVSSYEVFCQPVCPKIFIESKYKIENSLKMTMNLSQEFTVIGMNREALIEEDKYFEKGEMGLADPKCLIIKDTNLKAIPAMSFISQILKKNDVVILNECHNFPQHRVFFYNLLDSLKDYGFNSLFIETLSYSSDDSVYQKENDIENWGYYTIENVFHQVSRKWSDMNYKLYSYEVGYPRKIDTARIDHTLFFVNKSDIKWLPIKADSLLLKNFFSANENIQREAEQALNIYQKIIRNHIKKVFIYCGYTHAFKLNYFMAGMLKHLLKKDVYSIDQMYLREHSKTKYENIAYTKYAAVPYSFIIVDSMNVPTHAIQPKKKYVTDTLFDAAVASPRSVYINNRPTWLELNGERKRYNLSRFMEITDMKDFLVTIYDLDKKEQTKQISGGNELHPVDVFQVIGQGKNYDAILRPNRKYNFRVQRDGKVIIDKIIDTNE